MPLNRGGVALQQIAGRNRSAHNACNSIFELPAMPLRFRALPLMLTLSLASYAAHAATTVFTVNRSVGAMGTIVGTIETDGSVGVLKRENILDWNLSINADADASQVGRLQGPSSGGGSNFSFFPLNALSVVNAGDQGNALTFNFGVSSFQVFQLANADSSVVWQMQAGGPFQDELIREAYSASQPIQAFQYHGPVTLVIGTVSAVPEPNSAWMALAGGAVLLLGASRKKRQVS